MDISSKKYSVGIEDFDKLITDGQIYVDKTQHLRSLLTAGGDVNLLLRPRRFGKTLSMSMIQNFLEMNYLDPEDRSRQEKLFDGLAVLDDKELCDKYMGRYPVVSITLKEIEGPSFEDAFQSLLFQLGNLFEKFKFLLDSSKQSDEFKKSLKNKKQICTEENYILVSEINFKTAMRVAKESLKFLCDALYREYGRRVIVIIDEYDVPLQKATINGYYDEMLMVIRGMMGNALKTNNSMERGFVTGCLRIAHQSIFTGLNNFWTSDLKDPLFAKFIGFTKEDALKLLKDYGLEARLPDVMEWYDGYNIAGADMLCPWSVLSYLSTAINSDDPSSVSPECFWNNSSGNDILELCMRHPDSNDSERLQNLIDGNTEEIEPSEFTTYPEITTHTDFETFITMMLHTGYFTTVKKVKAKEPGNIVVKIPNKEVLECFRLKRNYLFGKRNSEWVEQAYKLWDALFDGKSEDVQDIINNMLMTFISFRDSSNESYYHGFMTGVLGLVKSDGASFSSNKESGNGYSDIILRRVKDKKGVILEFKKSEDDRFVTLDNVCDKALEQIQANNYDFHLKQDHFREILKYGIAFTGKYCQVKKADIE